MKVSGEFYLRKDVTGIARDLLGKFLVTRIGDEVTSGMITETEAYEGVTDRASHAWNGRRTGRTEVMYARGGVAYIYFCYGMHSLFNIVTNAEGVPHAVLIRGVIPVDGLDIISRRSGKGIITGHTGSGPGRVAKILGLHFSMTGMSLTGDTIWLEDRGVGIGEEDVLTTKRIGIDYAGPDALLPYRFMLKPGILPEK